MILIFWALKKCAADRLDIILLKKMTIFFSFRTYNGRKLTINLFNPPSHERKKKKHPCIYITMVPMMDHSMKTIMKSFLLQLCIAFFPSLLLMNKVSENQSSQHQNICYSLINGHPCKTTTFHPKGKCYIVNLWSLFWSSSKLNLIFPN